MQTHILLVEDDPEIAKIIIDTFRHEGYEVAWATTGIEGWEDFKLGHYDIILVDLMLPEMDGFTLCKNIRWNSDVPIIIISARQEDEAKIEGLGLGADDYVAKPFSLSELKARVASHLRRWRRYQGVEEETMKLMFDQGLMIRVDERLVTLRGVPISLTAKEFDLLLVLAGNPTHVFSKSELFAHVWQQIGDEDLHTVTVHIKSLREKMGDPVKNPYFIQTVWGKGYRFIGEKR